MLLVDDDEVVRSVIRHHLEEEGASVMEAMLPGNRGGDWFIMPGLSGARWLARLRELLPEQKIVVRTGMLHPTRATPNFAMLSMRTGFLRASSSRS